MKQLTNLEKGLTVGLLSLTVFCMLTKSKVWDYKKVDSIEYNKAYNEKHPVIDTILGYYKNTNPILVRGNYKINGHNKIGVCTGGSQLWFTCSDDCKKCLYLQSE